MSCALQPNLEIHNVSAAPQIFSELAKLANLDSASQLNESPLLKKISLKTTAFEKLKFILPAFPAKSANRNKTFSAFPDFAEVLALKKLNKLCEKIKSIYPPGAEIIICSDGRVFNDIVMVSDNDLMEYKMGIKAIIATKKLKNLKTFSLDECYKHDNFELMRRDLLNNFSQPLEFIRHRVKSVESMSNMFNGIHRFMKEDLQDLHPELSNNQVMKISKKLTYQVIQRSGAWDNLLNKRFQNTLRLSIHPYPIKHHKFGIKLLHSKDRWATPWHNVALKTEEQIILIKRKQALALGAKLKFSEEKYAYYQV